MTYSEGEIVTITEHDGKSWEGIYHAPVYSRPGSYHQIWTPQECLRIIKNDWIGGASYDPDALTLINKVETADNQIPELTLQSAINNFVVGAKSAGIWTTLNSGVWRLLAGPRTLAGALVLGNGPNPINNGFVSGDYTRATGLTANGSTQYLELSYTPLLNNETLALYVVQPPSFDQAGGGIGNYDGTGGSLIFLDNKNPNLKTDLYSQTNEYDDGSFTGTDPVAPTPGFYGLTRTDSSGFRRITRGGTTEITQNYASVGLSPRDLYFLAREDGTGTPINFLAGEYSFLFAGEGLAAGGLLELRNLVTAYMSDISGL